MSQENEDYITLFTGNKFNPFNPKPEDICVEDIAHSLSQCCRFVGACSPFYCVADHSVRVSRLVNQRDALSALLHDAGEVVTSDVPTPVKKRLKDLIILENQITEVIFHKYNLLYPYNNGIKRADRVLLVTEMRDLVKDGIPDKPSLKEFIPLEEKIVPLSMEGAERAFLNRFYEINGK